MNMNIFAIGMFIIAPIALFCSRNGNGFLLCVIFLVLGFVCKWLGNGGLNPTVKIKREDWWEEHYKARLGIISAKKEYPDAKDDKTARAIADMVTRWANIPLPTEEEKENIAKSMGIVTYKMKQDAIDSWNRIQYEKYRIFEKIENDADWDKIGRGQCSPKAYISASKQALKYHLDYYSVFEEKPWDKPLTHAERIEVNKWMDEYEKRFMNEINAYIEDKTPIPTIDYHYKYGYKVINHNYNVKYGFERDEAIIWK